MQLLEDVLPITVSIKVSFWDQDWTCISNRNQRLRVEKPTKSLVLRRICFSQFGWLNITPTGGRAERASFSDIQSHTSTLLTYGHTH